MREYVAYAHDVFPRPDDRMVHRNLYVLDDVARVLAGSGAYPFSPDGAALDGHARTVGVMRYLRLTRDVLAAAGWVKRYAEAVLAEGDDAAGADPK